MRRMSSNCAEMIGVGWLASSAADDVRFDWPLDFRR